jgi:asparagine synthase (glutamine-hydrolysing)
MCGITGLLDPGGTAPAVESVERMVARLEHRGPDDAGVDTCTGQQPPVVVLGHTRLAIIDLSPAGRGPMHDIHDGRSITFNGEIYNYRALREQLASYNWQSQTDTEVILAAYARWGRASVKHLRGMFAFGLWDADRQELFLARDRLGIKPLYFYAAPTGEFVFASEVRALLGSRRVPRRLDPVALDEYLAYQSVPSPRTMIQGVRSLPPGAWLVVDRHGGITEGRYWDQLEDAAPEAGRATYAEARHEISQRLRAAVELHLVSDVPVAAFLSGGIDSSTVVALMREAGHVPHTFSVSFTERAYDESHHARQVARRFQTEHVEVLLREHDLLHQLPDALGAMDQPTGDGVNTFVIARAVRSAGLKVVLSGLGGDELFGGYPSFARLSRTAALFRTWGRAPDPLRALAARTVERLGGSSVRAYKTAAMLASQGTLQHLYPVTREVLSPVQRQALLQPMWSHSVRREDSYVQLLDGAFRESPGAGVLTSIAYAEGRTYMHDVLLRDTDQMSMAHGLEVRVPLLDHVLVEYVMGLPDGFRRRRGMPKALLVDSLERLLPTDIVHRPKQGFSLPFEVWMRGQLRGFCQERLGPNGLAGRAMFQHEAVRALWADFLGQQPHATWSRVWVLVVLEEWLRRNGL